MLFFSLRVMQLNPAHRLYHLGHRRVDTASFSVYLFTYQIAPHAYIKL